MARKQKEESPRERFLVDLCGICLDAVAQVNEYQITEARSKRAAVSQVIARKTPGIEKYTAVEARRIVGSAMKELDRRYGDAGKKAVMIPRVIDEKTNRPIKSTDPDHDIIMEGLISLNLTPKGGDPRDYLKTAIRYTEFYIRQ